MSDTGSYIVVFKAGTSKEKIDEAASKVESSGGKIGHRYEDSILGFSATLPDSILSPLQALDHLDFIESDGEVSIAAKNLGIK
ncbi:hypothetical protein HDU92_003655 [Lobulomyces angularis]|nr:hypothetical protein HDU92_003655 [Lobulomyces angularis]